MSVYFIFKFSACLRRRGWRLRIRFIGRRHFLVVMATEVLILEYRVQPWRPLTKLMFYYETMNRMVFLINNALRLDWKISPVIMATSVYRWLLKCKLKHVFLSQQITDNAWKDSFIDFKNWINMALAIIQCKQLIDFINCSCSHTHSKETFYWPIWIV